MKKKLKALIAMMSLCAIGAVGSAFAAEEAFKQKTATGNGNAGQFDQAIYLYWDSGAETSAGMTDINTMSVGSTVYRYLTVAPKSTKTVAGNVKVTFKLEESGGKVTGLSVDVYEVTELPASDSAAKTAIDEFDSEHFQHITLDEPDETNFVNLSISTEATKHESFGYYIIAVKYQGGADPLGGKVVMSQTFTAA